MLCPEVRDQHVWGELPSRDATRTMTSREEEEKDTAVQSGKYGI